VNTSSGAQDKAHYLDSGIIQSECVGSA
jgi:hypothetical protein